MVDELAEWAEQYSAVGSPIDLRPIEDCLPDLATRLYRTLQQALERASTGSSSAQSLQPEIFWAPGRILVLLGGDSYNLGGDSYKAATDNTLHSLEEALITAAYTLIEGSRAY
jgi:hypothetical protein